MQPAVLVTGGAGFIGSHVSKALAADGFLPVVVDDLSQGHREHVKWGPLVIGDVRDSNLLHSVFEKWRPTSVVHLAGFIAAGESVVNPSKYYDNNIQGMLSLLGAMVDRDVGRIVFSSSAAVYGAPGSMPIRETAPLHPTNPYGHTKAIGEQVLNDYKSHGINSVSLRYFNAAGADPDGELGECHNPETHLIPILLDVAAGNRPFIEIFGDQYRTPDGTCIRDFVHVSDLARAHVLSLRHLNGDVKAHAYNLGNGRGHSVREIISAVETVTGQRIPVRVKPPRLGDPPVLVADPALAMKALGWKQSYAAVATQIAHAWNWQLQRARFRATPASQHEPVTSHPQFASD